MQLGIQRETTQNFHELDPRPKANSEYLYSNNDAQTTENCYEALESMRQTHEISMDQVSITIHHDHEELWVT